ncbi:MAG: hypothetical protein ABI433_13425 [Burkholderiaceae bacterium]
MTVEVPSPSRGRRPGRRSLDTDLLRVKRLDIDLNDSELAHCQRQADAAGVPVRRWARRVLLGVKVAAAQPAELRAIWSETSTLQSNLNQVAARLDELRLAGELTQERASSTLVELLRLYPALYQLVRSMRLELATMRGAT